MSRDSLERNDVCKAIKQNLKRRSGLDWSVTGGRGTGWGWLRIMSPKARQVDDAGNPRTDGYGYMSDDDRVILAELLDLDQPVHIQGESIPASSDYWQEYLDRSAGKTPSRIGRQYWD